MITTDVTIKETYLQALAECKQVFAEVYHEEITPYTLLSWGLSRVIGTEPKEHVPASRWHNALCLVSERDVEDFDLWSRAAFDLHLGQLGKATETCRLESFRYQTCSYVSLPDLETETTAYIDREIKRVYASVRRNTKRYKELAESVRNKARKLTAKVLADRLEYQRTRLAASVDSDKREADKVRQVAYELENASVLVGKLCPDRAGELGEATRAMLDARLTHATRIERRLAGDLEQIEMFIEEMKGV